ncbi:hypothetical protein GBN24_13635 [Plesiomonas shigelloides]|uniref:phage holin family protein n=1 Tax=Plesiomonas shigelloides TaxID=703 RepID=UPI0012614F11|nr:phage holin family protein [Plesiomonas shigelloides]KAB7687902.1 hypothetical protein GBN24_13635 [Plesiomonas shigelloides]
MTELMTKIFDPKTVSLETIGGTRGSGRINREQVINAVAMAGQKAPQGFDALMVKISEAVLCGLLTVTVYHGFRMFGLQHESAAIFIGGAVGCLGAQEVRELMQSVINPVISAIASKRGVKNGPY